MRLRLPNQFRPWQLLLVLLLVQASASGQQPVPPATEAAGPSKSVFVNDVAYGKDPFFPRSTRREAKAPPVEVVRPVEVAVDGLKLSGTSGTHPNRLAIINNRTFAVGEEHTIKLGEQRLNVKCVEIRDDSVVVNVGGLTRELHFRRKP